MINRTKKEIKSHTKKIKKTVHLPIHLIQKEVHKFMSGYVDIVLPYYIDNLYRGRIWNKPDYPKHINELLCPPLEKIKYYGRLNTPHQQVLYLSETVQPIYNEIRAQKEDEIILIRIVPRIKSKTLKVSSFISTNFDCYNPLNLHPVRDELVKAIGYGEQYHSTLELRKQVSNIFATKTSKLNSNIYKLTSTIAKELFRHGVDGILYSSIQTNQVFTNFATPPEIMNTHLQGHTVVKVKLNQLNTLSHNVDVIKNGIVQEDGSLLWDNTTSFEFPSQETKIRN